MTGLPALLAALGLVGVSFALLSFLIVLFSGAGLASDLGWIGGNLTVGIVLLVSAAALNLDALRDRMSSGEARRASKYGTSAILATLLSIAILGMLGFLGTRYHKRFDWTEQQIHTLSDQTQKVLEGLETDVEALALVSKLDEAPVRELLDRYAYASERFVVEYADPNVRPGLLEQHGIDPQKLGRGLVRIAIGGDAVEVTEIDESSVTNAMVKLTRTGEKVVYFLEGRGGRGARRLHPRRGGPAQRELPRRDAAARLGGGGPRGRGRGDHRRPDPGPARRGVRGAGTLPPARRSRDGAGRSARAHGSRRPPGDVGRHPRRRRDRRPHPRAVRSRAATTPITRSLAR
jgi:hypothetical protein